ncbi:MAG: HAD family hydrolase [candidate division Zixibacteria bacterium]|nr:HAD family hydrolase [candidate division Zixibacteria bacterium]
MTFQIQNPIQEKIKSGSINAFVFDLDGVLIESISGIVASTNYSLRSLSLPEREQSEIVRYIGCPLPNMFAEFAPGVDYAKIRPLFREKAMETIVPGSNLLPHARQTLQRFKGAGHKAAIGSTKIRAHIDGIMQKFSLGPLIDAIVGGDEAAAKPAPDIFLLAVERMGASVESTLVIGDTINDIQAAREAGMSVVTIESGFGDREALAKNPSDYHFSDLRQFANFALDNPAINQSSAEKLAPEKQQLID